MLKSFGDLEFTVSRRSYPQHRRKKMYVCMRVLFRTDEYLRCNESIDFANVAGAITLTVKPSGMWRRL